jgi:hypothetical protein
MRRFYFGGELEPMIAADEPRPPRDFTILSRRILGVTGESQEGSP